MRFVNRSVFICILQCPNLEFGLQFLRQVDSSVYLKMSRIIK